MVKRNETTVTNPDARSNARESKSHDLVKEPSFPDGSIGKGKSWQAEGDYEYFEEGEHPYVGLAPGASLWQDIPLSIEANPVEGGRPDFWLGCEYDTGRLTDCWLEIYGFTSEKKWTLLQQREIGGIKPKASDARVTWSTLPLQRIVKMNSTITDIRIKFIAGKGNNRLHLRNTDLDVRLPELKAKVTLVVDPDGLAIEQKAPPYKVCHGARHRLDISDIASDSWRGEKASLGWYDEALPIQFGLQASPPFNRSELDEDSYQVLNEHTAWSVLASGDRDPLSGNLELGIHSYWQAEISSLAVSVGDYVYGLSEIRGGDNALVIDDENANEVVLTTTAFNHFRDERKVEGVEVEWRVNGEPRTTVPSNEQGQSSWQYAPVAADIVSGNVVEVTATVKSGVEGGQPSVQLKQLRVFASSPWPTLVDVFLDGKAVDFKSLGVHLTRGVRGRKLLLKPKDIADNYFIGKDVTLASPGGSAEGLGISFEPKTAQRMTKEGVEWTFDAGSTERGLFHLECSTPTLNVPFVMKGCQLSASVGDEVEVKFTGSTHKAWKVYWHGKAQVISLVPKQGSPLQELTPDTWMSFTAGTLEQEQMGAEPGYEGAVRPLLKEGLKWTLTGNATSGTFELAFHVGGFAQPLTLDNCALLAPVVTDEVTLRFEQAALKLPLIFTREMARTFSVVPNAKSPLVDMGLDVKLEFLPGTVTVGNMGAVPGFNVGKQLTAAGVTWTLTGGKVSGTFGLKLNVDLFAAFELKVGEAILMSASLADEADLDVDIYFFYNQEATVRLVPKSGSPLSISRLKTNLQFKKTGELVAQDIIAKPAYGKDEVISEGGYSWVLTGGNKSGWFSLTCHVEDFTDPLVLAEALLISPQLEDEAQVYVNGLPLPSPTVFLRTEIGTLNLLIKPGSPLERVSELTGTLLFVDGEGSLESEQVPFWPTYGEPQVVTDGELQWSLCMSSKSGTFGVEIVVGKIPGALKMKNCHLMYSKLNSEVFIDGGAQLRLLRPEAPDTLVLRWSRENPLIAAGEKIYVITDAHGDLVKLSPESDTRIEMTTAGRAEWKVDALSKNGVVKLTVMGEKTGELAEIEYVVMSSNVSEVFAMSEAGVPLSYADYRYYQIGVGKVLTLEPIGCFGSDSNWRVSIKWNIGRNSMFARTLRVEFENSMATFEVNAEMAEKEYAFILHYKNCFDIDFSDSIRFGTRLKLAEGDKPIEP